MRIHSTRRKVILSITFVLGIVLALVSIEFSKYFFVLNLPSEILLGISILSILLLLLCPVMLIEEDSRAGGALLIAIFLPLLISFSDHIPITGVPLIIGLVCGSLLDLLAFGYNRFDILSKASKIVITVFLLFLFFYLFRCYEAGLGIRLIIAASIIAVSTYIGLLKVIRGVKAGNVFVVGPSGSGKTVFSTSFYTYITRNRLGTLSYLIQVGGSTRLTMGKMFSTLNRGEWIRGTEPSEIRLIGMRGEKWGITPVKTAIIDYSGGYFEDIPDSLTKYNKLSKEVMDAFPEDLKPSSPIGTYSFMEWLRRTQEEGKINLSPSLIKNIILTSICKNLRGAGKIIFLVDGEEIKSYIEEVDNGLAEHFDMCVEIINRLGGDKKYSLIITKADELDNSLEIDRRNMEEEEFDQLIYDKLKDIPNFLDITNRVNIPIDFFTLCIETYKRGEKRFPISGMHIWGYDNPIRWIF